MTFSIDDEGIGSQDGGCWGWLEEGGCWRSNSGWFGLCRVLSKASMGRLPSGTSKSETSSAVRFTPARIVCASAKA